MTALSTNKDMTAKKLSDLLPDTLPKEVKVALNEVEFTKTGCKYEQLYRRTEHKDTNGHSKFRLAAGNIKEDLALMVRALYSHEPSLVRYRRSVVVPDIVLVMITAATLEIATGVLSKAYSYVSSLIAK